MVRVLIGRVLQVVLLSAFHGVVVLCVCVCMRMCAKIICGGKDKNIASTAISARFAFMALL